MKTIKQALAALFARAFVKGFTVTDQFDAKTRAALNLAAANAHAKTIARLSK